MPATQKRRWTPAEVRELIDANPLLTPRYELVDGELLVTPAPRRVHQDAVRLLLAAMQVYLRPNPIGQVMISPFDVEVEPETLVQPDLFVVPLDEWKRLGTEPRATNLLLAVEILSPSSSRHDRGAKRRLYQRAGVPEYWVVDLDARLVERWRPDDTRPEVLQKHLEWRPPAATESLSTESLSIDLEGLFAEVFGEGSTDSHP